MNVLTRVILAVVLAQAFVYGDWRSDANDRIEQYRKGDAVLQVRDAEGNPIPNREVTVRQIRRNYAFGAQLDITQLITYGGEGSDWEKFFIDNFEWATIRQILWGAEEPTQGTINHERLEIAYDFCEKNDIKMRGHRLFSGGGDVEWTETLSNNDLQDAMLARTGRVIRWGIGKFENIDIWNEITEVAERDFYYSRFGDSIYPLIMSEVANINPDAGIIINDYSLVVGEGDLIEDFKAVIQSLLDAGVPIDGIGVQCHFNPDYGFEEVDPIKIYANLESLAELGLPIWGTEFHCESSDENIRADRVEKFYRTFFSHPSTVGIIMWGWWGSSHGHPYGPEASITNADFSLNAAGDMYVSMMDEWKTDVVLSTDASGNIDFRGFYGEYEVTINGVTEASEKESFYLEILPDAGSVQETFVVDTNADINNDGIVNLEEFVEIAIHFYECSDPIDPVNCIDYEY